MARIPAELTTPMSPRELMQVSDLPLLPSKSQMQSVAAASYHFAITGATILNRWKTAQLKRANGFFLAGLVFLGLSLPGNSWTLGSRPPSLEVKPQLRANSQLLERDLRLSGFAGPALAVMWWDSYCRQS